MKDEKKMEAPAENGARGQSAGLNSVSIEQLERGDLKPPPFEGVRTGGLAQTAKPLPQNPLKEVLGRIAYLAGVFVLFLALGLIVRALARILHSSEFVPIVLLLACGGWSIFFFRKRQSDLVAEQSPALVQDAKKLHAVLHLVPTGCLIAALLSALIARSAFAFAMSMAAALLSRAANHDIWSFLMLIAQPETPRFMDAKKENRYRIALSFAAAVFLLLFMLLLLRSLLR